MAILNSFLGDACVTVTDRTVFAFRFTACTLHSFLYWNIWSTFILLQDNSHVHMQVPVHVLGD